MTLTMLGAPQLFPTATILLSFLSALISSHTVITYPGWRGDNLHTNGSITGLNGTVFPPDVIGNSGLGVGDNNTYPYGMQWIYPCSLCCPHHPLLEANIQQVVACPCRPTEPSGL